MYLDRSGREYRVCRRFRPFSLTDPSPANETIAKCGLGRLYTVSSYQCSCDVLVANNKKSLLMGFILIILLFLFVQADVKIKADEIIDALNMQFIINIINILLPRSFFELNAILSNNGVSYYLNAILLYLIVIVCGYIFIFQCVRKFLVYQNQVLFSSGINFCSSSLLALFSLVLRQPSFEFGPFWSDYVDKSGLFLIKEGCFMLYGFYCLGIVATNVILYTQLWLKRHSD